MSSAGSAKEIVEYETYTIKRPHPPAGWITIEESQNEELIRNVLATKRKTFPKRNYVLVKSYRRDEIIDS